MRQPDGQKPAVGQRVLARARGVAGGRRAAPARPRARHRRDGDFGIVWPNFVGQSHDLANGSRRLCPCERKERKPTVQGW